MVSTKALIKNPSAWLPISMSCTALAFTLGYLLLFGMTQARKPQGDEGVAAHIFQLLMGGQLPVIAYFAIRYVPQKPSQAVKILALQFIAGVLAFAPVFFLEL